MRWKSSSAVLACVVVILLAAAAAGCQAQGPAGGGDGAVTLKDIAFTPDSVTVKQGESVTWSNSDSVAHTVTADAPSLGADFDKDLAPGESFKFAFEKAGTFPFHCNIHPSMHGTVKVE